MDLAGHHKAVSAVIAHAAEDRDFLVPDADLPGQDGSRSLPAFSIKISSDIPNCSMA